MVKQTTNGVFLDKWSSHTIAEACLGMHIRRAARSITRQYEEFLRPLELTLGQFSILATLHWPEPKTMNQLSNELGLDRTTLTANLRPLERRHLVQVVVDDADHRRRGVTLTEDGRHVLATALPLWEEAQRIVIAGLSQDVESLKHALAELG